MYTVSPMGLFRQLRSGIEDQEGERYGDISSALADGMVSVLEGAARSEFESRIGATCYERSSVTRQDYRNGLRTRSVQSSASTVVIRIPRMRNQGFVPSFLTPGCRALSAVEEWVATGYLCGLSRTEICRFLERLTGLQPGPSVLARVEQRLDASAKSFKVRPLSAVYEYLFLDAAWVKDIVGKGAVRVCILTAVGITPDGRKEILGFERVIRENESSWRGFLGRLKDRGLNVSELALVISDEHRGLVNAVAEVLGDVAHQLCWAHRVRNVVDKVSKIDRKRIVEDLRQIYRAARKSEAVAAWSAFSNRWVGVYPSVVQSIQQDLRYLLAFLDRPRLHHAYVRTSNPIERVFRDLRKRGYGCGAFADRKSCDRVLYSVYQLLNDLWADKSLWLERQKIVKQAGNEAR